MERMSLIRYLQLTCFSRPRCDRVVYRRIAKLRPARILEMGMGTADRALRMLEMTARYSEPGQMQYVGVDLFDGRTRGAAPLKLKDAYRILRQTGANIRLIPGEPVHSLRQLATSGLAMDLIVADSSMGVMNSAEAMESLVRVMGEKAILLTQSGASPQIETRTWTRNQVIEALQQQISSRRAA